VVTGKQGLRHGMVISIGSRCPLQAAGSSRNSAVRCRRPRLRILQQPAQGAALVHPRSQPAAIRRSHGSQQTNCRDRVRRARVRRSPSRKIVVIKSIIRTAFAPRRAAPRPAARYRFHDLRAASHVATCPGKQPRANYRTRPPGKSVAPTCIPAGAMLRPQASGAHDGCRAASGDQRIVGAIMILTGTR
jgi:hypothetical protein